MELENAMPSSWVGSYIARDIDTNFSRTFSSKEESSLQLRRLGIPLGHPQDLVVHDVSSVADLERFSQIGDRCQIFIVRQKHSYARLKITKELFESLIHSYSIFQRIWDFTIPFSFKTHESDISNAPFRFKQLECKFFPESKLGSFECAYGFRYVEQNYRTFLAKENPDYDPWSSERVTLAQVSSEDEKLSPLTDFAVNFVDRQRLKMIEDKVLDLIIIFESLYNTLSNLKRQCETHCLGENCPTCTCTSTMEEFEEQMHEAKINLKKANILHKRAKGTAQLLSDLLNYENAQIANLLFKETKDENSKMRVLTERSTRDAAAVRVLTVITLLYLPMTVVANFFSSQLIHVDDNGSISVISASWWFAVVSIPLTIVTLVVWRLWLSRSIKAEEGKHVEKDIAQKESIPSKHWSSSKKLNPRDVWINILRLRKRPEHKENLGA